MLRRLVGCFSCWAVFGCVWLGLVRLLDDGLGGGSVGFGDAGFSRVGLGDVGLGLGAAGVGYRGAVGFGVVRVCVGVVVS